MKVGRIYIGEKLTHSRYMSAMVVLSNGTQVEFPFVLDEKVQAMLDKEVLRQAYIAMGGINPEERLLKAPETIEGETIPF